jgi:tetratricopeptide (TPR) repeat protein
MYFQISKLIIWPKSGEAPREVDFQPGKINVITGASKTGKSAIIPIVDYCLGSDGCSIPVGIIRKSSAWFGVVVNTVQGQLLIARREPGEQKSTDDFFVLEGTSVEVPQVVPGKNKDRSHLKRDLDRMAGLPSLGFDPGSENPSKTRPAFRDLMAFTFQPQNVVANPDVLFFKADTTEHREKLKTIFPYVLGAVTLDVLLARYEIEQLSRELRRKEARLAAETSSTDAWRAEVSAWFGQAQEFGLLSSDQQVPSDWNDTVDILRSVSEQRESAARPDLRGMSQALERLEALRREETETSKRLFRHRRNLNEMRRLIESSEQYGDALRIQRDRLSLSTWLRTLGDPSGEDALAQLEQTQRWQIETLCKALEEVEIQASSQPLLSDRMDKELVRERAAAEAEFGRLNEIRLEMRELEKRSEDVEAELKRSEDISRFLGRLTQALTVYDRADQTGPIREEVNSLKERIDELRRGISDGEIARRLRNALAEVDAEAMRLVKYLDAENPDNPIRLMIRELTVQVVDEGKEAYLWEIGSGANWLAYHVATLLALHVFFLKTPHHPAPSFLVFDQPSQVYFPRALVDREDSPTDFEWKDEDIRAVRKIFDALSSVMDKATQRMQIIILDHAGEDVWGDFEHVYKVAEWRDGEKLIPETWLV